MSFKFVSSTGSTAGGYIKRDISSSLIGLQAFDHSEPYAIMCWLRCDKFVAHTGFIEDGYINASPVVSIGSTGTGTSTTNAVSTSMNRDQVTISPEGELMIGVFTNGVNGPFVIQKTGVTISLDVWVHIALVRESTTVLKLYVNGDLTYTLGSVSVAGRAAITSLSTWGIRFGYGICYYKSTATSTSRTVGLRYLSGAVAHIKIWDQLLTAAEIKRESIQVRAAKTEGLYSFLPTYTTTGTVPTSGGDLDDKSGSVNSFTKTSTATYDVDPDTPDIFTSIGRSLRFSGRSGRAARKLFDGSLSFDGVFNTVQQRAIKLSGALGMSGNAVRNTVRLLTGSLRTTGLASRGWTKSLAGTLGFTGRLTPLFIRLMTLTASLGLSGSTTKSLIKRMVATLGLQGALPFGRITKLVATLRMGGNLNRSFSKILGGSLGLFGYATRSMTKRITGLLGFAGDYRSLRKGVIMLTRALRLSGGSTRSILRRLEGILGLVGLFPRNRKLTINRVLRFNRALKNISAKNMIVQVFRLLGSWRTSFYLDGEIDE